MDWPDEAQLIIQVALVVLELAILCLPLLALR